MIRVTCPACRFSRDYDDHLGGWQVSRRECRASLAVPARTAERVERRTGADFGPTAFERGAEYLFQAVGAAFMVAVIAACCGWIK